MGSSEKKKRANKPWSKGKVKRQMAKKERQNTGSLWLAACCFFVITFALSSCHSGAKKAEPAQQSDEHGIAEFAFSEELHNFGSLNAGEIVSYTFVFRNSGTKTLTITNVDSGCGCMEVKIPEKSIAPGDEGRIEVIYNSAGEVGNQLKTIILYSNAEPTEKQLFIRASVTNDLIKIYS